MSPLEIHAATLVRLLPIILEANRVSYGEGQESFDVGFPPDPPSRDEQALTDAVAFFAKMAEDASPPRVYAADQSAFKIERHPAPPKMLHFILEPQPKLGEE